MRKIWLRTIVGRNGYEVRMDNDGNWFGFHDGRQVRGFFEADNYEAPVLAWLALLDVPQYDSKGAK